MASWGGRGEGALWRGAEPNRARGGVLAPPSGNARRATRWGALQAAGGAGSSAAHGRLPAREIRARCGRAASTAARAGAPRGATVRSFRVYMSMENVHSPPGGQQALDRLREGADTVRIYACSGRPAGQLLAGGIGCSVAT